MVMAPLSGIIVDKFRVKKRLFFTTTLLLGLTSYCFMFVPKVPLDIAVEMKCEDEIILSIVRAETVQQNTQNSTSIFNDKNNDELITCKVRLNNMIKNIKMFMGLERFCWNKC